MNLFCFFVLLASFSFVTSATPNALTTCLDITHSKYSSAPNSHYHYLEKLSHYLNRELVIVNQAPFSRCLLLLEKGEIDILPGLIANPKRQQHAHFIAYGTSQKRVLFYKRGAIENAFTDDKSSLTVGVLRGEVLSAYEQQWLKGKRVYYYNDVERAFNLLEKERLALLLTNKAAFDSVSLAPEVKQHIAMDLLPEQVARSVHFAISNKAFSRDLHAKVAEFVKVTPYAEEHTNR